MTETEHAIRLSFLGGAMEVGASAILAEIGGKRILMDCGIRQKAGADPLPDLRLAQERGGVDAIVVSHAHMDHTGSLPVISKAYPFAPIYATSMTIDLTRVLLYDSIKLMNRQDEGIPVYAEKDVEAMFSRMRAVHYEQPLEILPGITLTMYQAGHIAGAACIYLQSPDGTLFYSGDFCSFAQNTIEGIRIPRLRPDIAIVESTYGDRLHSNRQVEERRLIETAAECIKKKGKMLIPVFALGRAQEVLLILRCAMSRKELPPVKVYVDGMVRDMNIAYSRNPYYLKNALAKRIEHGNEIFYSDEITAVPRTANREELLNTADPVIFVSSSGMLTGGPSVEYAKKIAGMENGYIVITGYQDEDAPGRQIMELLEEPEAGEGTPACEQKSGDRTLNLSGTRIPVRCTLRKAALSAHGDKGEIAALLQTLSARSVFFVHGDGEVIRELSLSLEPDYRTRIFTPVCGQEETIWLRSPRQQLKKIFPYTMQRTEELSGRDREFWQYLSAHYPARKFTVADLAFVWYGKAAQEDSVLKAVSSAVSESRFFARDSRRLFLFVCRTEEEIREEEKKDSVMTQQKLRAAAEECFGGLAYRRMGFFEARQEVGFTFDFPREAAERFDAAAGEFSRRTGWKAVRNDEPNEAAMQTLLQEYLGAAIQKISIRKLTAEVSLKLSSFPEAEVWEKLRTDFERRTGYRLTTDDGEEASPAADSGTGSGWDGAGSACRIQKEFFLPGDARRQEQNFAFSLIDMEFESARFAPYKKSIKNDSEGKYIQLAFLSPALGRAEADRLESLARQTGWRLQIAPSVNQNVISAMAVRICRENGVSLKKLPSYQPAKQRLTLKPSEGGAEVLERIRAEIEAQTGIACEVETSG